MDLGFESGSMQLSFKAISVTPEQVANVMSILTQADDDDRGECRVSVTRGWFSSPMSAYFSPKVSKATTLRLIAEVLPQNANVPVGSVLPDEVPASPESRPVSVRARRPRK